MMKIIIQTLLLLPAVFAINATVEVYVNDAILEALSNFQTAEENEKSVADGTVVSSQIASSQSKQLQFTGDVLEEATRILVAKYGLEILPAANEVLAARAAVSDAEDATTTTTVQSIRVKREYRHDPESGNCTGPPKSCSDSVHDRIRSITGYCNNRQNALQANALQPIRRLLGTTSYTDGLQKMRDQSVTGSVLPSARVISNSLYDEGTTPNYSPSVNHLHMQIGQFIAHDMIFMPSSVAKDGSSLDCTACNSATNVSTNCAPIAVPDDDAYFKPATSGKRKRAVSAVTPQTAKRCIRLIRSLNGQSSFGVRTQIDQNTHYLDMSVVYGSSDCEAQTVRSFTNGLLKEYTGVGYVLPPQNANDSNCQSTKPYYCFTAGDFRNCLHPGLIPIHTLFVKEHNRHAAVVLQQQPRWSDEQIYQFVRKIMIGVWQNIVYSEYLPMLLSDKYLTDFNLKVLAPGSSGDASSPPPPPPAGGPTPPPPPPPPRGRRDSQDRKGHRGRRSPNDIYNANMDASLSGEFAASAFRFGHSQARQDFLRQDPTTNKTIGGYDLGNNTFYADQQYQSSLGGTETILTGFLKTAAMKVDRYFSFPIRNQIFEIRGKPGSGVDLPSVNIQRGRDVGLLPYVKYRTLVGLTAVNAWTDLSSTFSAANLAALQNVYASPADIDLYVGIVMETPVSGGQLGPTASWIISEQFRASKTGDRFYFESQVDNTVGFTPEQMDAIRRYKLAKVVCENTAIVTKINSNVFDLVDNSVACTTIPDLDLSVFFN